MGADVGHATHVDHLDGAAVAVGGAVEPEPAGQHVEHRGVATTLDEDDAADGHEDRSSPIVLTRDGGEVEPEADPLEVAQVSEEVPHSARWCLTRVGSTTTWSSRTR